MALAADARGRGDLAAAEEHYLAAETDFPGFADGPSAELQLARIYAGQGRVDDLMRARERWLAFDSGEYGLRLGVAAWHAEHGRHAEAERFYAEANEVDPFRRELHRLWAAELEALDRPAEAAREYRVARLVPVEFDVDGPPPLSKRDEAQLLGLEARAWLAAGDEVRALEAAQQALALDPKQKLATEVIGDLQ